MDPVDAYEFSFVAVPAQPMAGALKGKAGGRVALKELADRFGAQEEYRELFKMAQLGQQYEKGLEQDVVRLCLALELPVEEPMLRNMAGKLGVSELEALEKALKDDE
jgi:hypothetical protein